MGAQDSHQSWHELPFWTLVKNYLRIAIIFFIVGWASTRIANLDILVLQFHLQNMWLLAPETGIVIGGLWIWNWSRTSEKKKRQKQAKERLQTLIQEAGGEQKK